mmetsp:Transcript_28135/g.62777  ORF Transcript_28135/g.62777 Transcript_28135/m.62777 type:complete len:660 (+) Transcript_28135:192-2171(+)
MARWNLAIILLTALSDDVRVGAQHGSAVVECPNGYREEKNGRNRLCRATNGNGSWKCPQGFSVLDKSPFCEPPHALCQGTRLSYLGRVVRSQNIEVESINPNERYAATIDCAGNTFLFSRAEHYDDDGDEMWSTVVRVAARPLESATFPVDFRTLEEPEALMPISHNASPDCVKNKTLVLYGGQHHQDFTAPSSPKAPFYGGVKRFSTTLGHSKPAEPSSALKWSDGGVVFNGDSAKNQCVEGRTRISHSAPGICEWDGKFALVRFGGRLLVYGRANIKEGGRAVQVATSEDDGQSWGGFQMVSIDSVSNSKEHVNNIYFFTAGTYFDRVSQRERVVALFPGVLGDLKSAGVHVTTSEDGIQFGPPKLIMSGHVAGPRTPDYPVEVRDLGRGKGVSFIVQHNVQIDGAVEKHTHFCRYEMSGSWETPTPFDHTDCLTSANTSKSLDTDYHTALTQRVPYLLQTSTVLKGKSIRWPQCLWHRPFLGTAHSDSNDDDICIPIEAIPCLKPRNRASDFIFKSAVLERDALGFFRKRVYLEFGPRHSLLSQWFRTQYPRASEFKITSLEKSAKDFVGFLKKSISESDFLVLGINLFEPEFRKLAQMLTSEVAHLIDELFVATSLEDRHRRVVNRTVVPGVDIKEGFLCVNNFRQARVFAHILG